MGLYGVLASLGQVEGCLLAYAGVGPRDDHRLVLQPRGGGPGSEEVSETCVATGSTCAINTAVRYDNPTSFQHALKEYEYVY